MTNPKYIFKRVTIIDIEGANWSTTFNGNDFHITFEVPFDSDTAPNEITVNIYNLTKLSVGRLGKGMSVSVQAGYVGNYGVLSRGKLTSIRTYREGADRITELKIIDGMDVSAKTAEKNITFKKGVLGEVIIKKLVDLLGLRLTELKLPDNKPYPKGYIVSGKLMNHLITVAKDCGASVFWKRGNLVIRSLKEATSEICFLSEDTGLIGSPEYFADDSGKGYRAKSLLQHKITPGVLVEFKSRTSNGQYRARKGKHVGNGSEFITEVEVI
ncbi:hypothetical protein AWH48_12005 [Domibacillus aminovorans]|uniref:Uncharacterized protein n=1 Tax=Domibacillus aminovorans TaxID=29332 RepID=A0A177KJL1_9BACI|nr:hypothetical protein [Domibacillus aminovorans]OAH53075.1 hypothetical protein AWH48_12005 [Domibacillus aminovorans]